MWKSGALAPRKSDWESGFSPCRSYRVLQCERHSHASADTKRRHSFSCIALQHLVEKRYRDARARATDRMPEGNGAAIDVQAIAIEVQSTIARENLCGKGFVEFHQPKFVQTQTVFVFELLQCRDRPDSHCARIDSGRTDRCNTRQWFEIVLLHEMFAGDDHRGCA